MAIYLIGDVQGCYAELRALLLECKFNPSRDQLILLGDLVNRGPQSREVLQYVRELGDSASALLGNHDLHLLATAHGARKPSRHDTFDDVLNAADAPVLLDWLRHQSLASFLPSHHLLCVHAGVLPQWTLDSSLQYAHEIETILRRDDFARFFPQMYGNSPNAWADNLQGADRLRIIVNAFTRLRFCSDMKANGTGGEMDFETKEGADAAPTGFMPWFEIPARRTRALRIAFGHWSTLGLRVNPHIAALDTGCVWGGALSALRIADATMGLSEQVFQVQSKGYQQPV